MAIKIPSKNIYELNNPKIRDNFIDYIDVNCKKVLPDTQSKVIVLNKRFDGDFVPNEYTSYERQNVIQNIPNETNSETNPVYYIRTAYSAIIPVYFNANIEIPIHIDKSFITELTLQEKNEDGTINAITNYSVYGLIENGILNQNFTVTYDSTPLNEGNKWTFNSDILTPTSITQYAENINIQLLENAFLRVETQKIDKKDDLVADLAENYISNETNLKTVVATIDTTKDCFIIKNLKLLVGATSIGGTFGTRETLHKNGGSYSNSTVGTYTKYIPTYIELNIYGNTVGIKLDDTNLSYGIGNKPFSVGGNELLQNSATTNGIATTEFLSTNILEQYKNGKETATLLCSISDYYDEQGNKKIGIDQSKMSFQNHDLVIPYVFGADGKDKPMSRYSSGKPKVFEVVSTRKFFDGAVWQELNLLEVLENT